MHLIVFIFINDKSQILRLPFLFCGQSFQILYIAFSVTSIASTGLLTWSQYYKISLLFTDSVQAKRIHLIGIIGGILIGLFGGILVLLSSLYDYYLINPNISTFTLNGPQLRALLVLERLIYLLSILLNMGSESYVISLLLTQETIKSSIVYILSLCIGLISDMIGIIGILLYLTSFGTRLDLFSIVIVNWIRISFTVNIWCQSYSSDLYKLLIKRDRRISTYNLGKQDSSFTSGQIIKSLPDF